MTDLTLPPSARRFASFLDREYCVWMPSFSVALLSALVTGKGRPKRLLVEEDAPAFVSNIGLVTGATPVKLSPTGIDTVLEGLLRTEGLSPAHVWAVATHRDGELSPTDWISKCAASGVPTIELCSGSLFALARWGRSPATFTIVDLDAEVAFAGAHLSALLTDDRATAVRVQRLCLPGPESRDYVFDAGPRGLEHDEPALESLLERVTAGGGEKSRATGDAPVSTHFWARLFQSAEPVAAPTEDNLWRSRLAEAEARHAEALGAATANVSSLQSRLDDQLSLAEEWQQRFRATESEAASRAERDSMLLSESRNKLDEMQRTVDQWEARFREAESEAAENATILSRARAEVLERRRESEQSLASLDAEREALAQKLALIERERGLAVADADRRDVSERKIQNELRQRVEQLEKAAKATADQEARQKKAAEASRAKLSAKVARLEKEAADFDQARADLLKQRTKADQALASVQSEKQNLARKLEGLDAELSETLADSAKRAAEQRKALDEQAQRAAKLEREVADLTAREAANVREGKASRTGLSKRIAELEGEKEVLANRLSAVESGRDKAMADAARRAETQLSAITEQKERAERLKAEVAAHKEGEARLREESAQLRAELSEHVRRSEAEAGAAHKAAADLRAERAATERALARARAEGIAASEKLAEAERRHAQALAEAVGSREALRFSLTERIDRLEADYAPGEKARGDLAAQKEELERRHALLVSEKDEAERSRALLLSEKEALSRNLVAAVGERDRARLEAEERGEALRRAIEEETQRVEQPGGVSEQAEMAERIARLEAAAAEAEEAHTKLVGQLRGGAEQAAASMRAEAEATARKLAEIEKDRADELAEAARRAETQEAALQQQRRRAEQLEREAADRTEHETRLTDDWALLRAEMSDRIARMEAVAVASENAQKDLVAQKAEGDLALASIRAEKQALSTTLAKMENNHSTALADAAKREDAQRLALDAEKQRAKELEQDAAALIEREANLNTELETSRSEWSERLRQALSPLQAERENLVTLLAQTERDRDDARGEIARLAEAHRVQLNEQTRLMEGLKADAAVEAERVERQAEAREASRAELVVRIARLEADAVLADKARTELLNRKRDSDRTLAEAQDERAALIKKLAIAEHGRDQAQATAARLEEPAKERMAGGASPGDGQPPSTPDASRRSNTGGLSALVNLWTTGRTRRPFRRKETEGEPPGSEVSPASGIEAIPGEAPSSSAPDPIPEGAADHKSIRPAEVPAARMKGGHKQPPAGGTSNEDGQPRPRPDASGGLPDAGGGQDTGGLSALVGLWNTAVISRPPRSKETEEKPPDPPLNPAFDIEVIAGEVTTTPSGPTPTPPIRDEKARGKRARPAPGESARPNPRRRPQPKPAPEPDETEKLGGWLRGLARRMGRKD